MAGVVDKHIEAPVLLDDGLHRGFRRGIRGDIEFDDAKVDVSLLRFLQHSVGIGRIATGDVAHARVNGVTSLGQGACRQQAETTRAPVIRMTCFMTGSPRIVENRGLQSDDAAVGAQHLAVDPAAIGAGEEGHGGGDVIGRAEAL